MIEYEQHHKGLVQRVNKNGAEHPPSFVCAIVVCMQQIRVSHYEAHNKVVHYIRACETKKITSTLGEDTHQPEHEHIQI